MYHYLKPGFVSLLTLLFCLAVESPAYAQWQETSFQMKLIDLLDREDGYCLDAVGSGNVIRFDVPLIAHNCKEGLYADEAVVHNADGTIYFPVYDGCVTVMGLNYHALAYTSLMIKKCNVDEAFLKATSFQKFIINEHNQLQLDASDLCITAGSTSKPTFSPDHRWRSLYMQRCTETQPELSQWGFVKPG